MPKSHNTRHKLKAKQNKNKIAANRLRRTWKAPAPLEEITNTADSKNTQTKPHYFSHSMFFARADHSQKLDDGTLLKTSYKLDAAHAQHSPATRKRVEKNPPESYRPFKRVAYSPTSNAPRAVFTPDGQTKLQHVGIDGAVHIFSNNPHVSRRLVFDNPETRKDEFENSAQFRRIKKWMGKIKTKSTIISAKTLEASKKEKIANNNRRLTSQAKAMTKSGHPYSKSRAADYTNAAFKLEKEFANIQWDWTHLIANFILGEVAQKSANIVSATKHCNTAMILSESQIRKLSRRYPKGFTLKVISEQINETHVSNKITMQIITPDFTCKHVFNGLETHQPHKDYKRYFDTFYNELIENAKLNKEEPNRKPKR